MARSVGDVPPKRLYGIGAPVNYSGFYLNKVHSTLHNPHPHSINLYFTQTKIAIVGLSFNSVSKLSRGMALPCLYSKIVL